MNTVYMSCTARLVFPKPEYFITHTQNHTQKNCLRILSKRELYSSVLATKIDSKITKAHTMPTFALFSPSCFYHPALSHLLFVSPLFTSHLLSHLVLSLSRSALLLPHMSSSTPLLFSSINHFVALFFFFFFKDMVNVMKR